MSFPDPSKPIATCTASSCVDCPVPDRIHCHFRPGDLVHFMLVCLPCFLIGGAVLLASGLWSLGIWIAILAGYFGLLEIRVMCSHCPHYAEKGRTLGCWANHGSPKLWRYHPGPMSTAENVLFFGGLVVVWCYPLPFFFTGGRWFLLALYLLTSTAFFTTLNMFLCTRCMNFACPLNSVDEAVRDLFFQRNPSVAEAWGRRPEDAGQ